MIPFVIKQWLLNSKPLEFQKCAYSGRKQFVEIEDQRSSEAQVKFSVPQGSVLGPRPFSIYVNDLTQAPRKCLLTTQLYIVLAIPLMTSVPRSKPH